jgi:hypothetical protein
MNITGPSPKFHGTRDNLVRYGHCELEEPDSLEPFVMFS